MSLEDFLKPKAPCSFDDHKWQMEIDDGRARIICVDPCPEPGADYPDNTPLPTCHAGWESEDFTTAEKPIPVRLKFVDDSSPGGPWGPAEYGFWIELEVASE